MRPPNTVYSWDANRRPQPHAYGFGRSPFGLAIVLFDEVGLCGLGFGQDAPTLAVEMGIDDGRRQDAAAIAALKTIFDDNEPLVVHMAGTPWQMAVWQALTQIPYGTTMSYGALAAALGRPQAARAVGRAVGANPVAWLLPCHRVVGKDGALTGFRWGIAVKKAMLAWEKEV